MVVVKSVEPTGVRYRFKLPLPSDYVYMGRECREIPRYWN